MDNKTILMTKVRQIFRHYMQGIGSKQITRMRFANLTEIGADP
jgi:hypothetical protein